jgi:hypothetical protein
VYLAFHQGYQPVAGSRTIRYSLILTSLIGALAMVQAYLLPAMIPSP